MGFRSPQNLNLAYMTYTFPCTRNIGMEGFGTFLEQEIAEPRRNLNLFRYEFGDLIGEGDPQLAHRLTLVNSGSSANLVAAMAVASHLRSMQRPLTAIASAFTFPTTLSALLLAGFKVKLIDVGPKDFNLSVADLKAEKDVPSMVCVTHFLGFPADLDALDEYRRHTGCLILQDACETMTCHTTDGTPLYRYGDIVTWSFYHPHHLSSYGGGAIYAATEPLHIEADSIAHWGRACKCHIDPQLCKVPEGPAHQFTYERIGVNVEMSELNACFGRWQLRHWTDIESRRQSNYGRLYALLDDHPRLKVWPFFNARHDSPFVFPIYCRDKIIDDVFSLLYPKGIEIRTLMGGATCQQPAFKDIVFDHNDEAIHMASHTFFVGCHHTLTLDDVEHVGKTIANLL